MRVTISFTVDDICLKMAIANLMWFGSLRMNKENIIETIKNEVYNKGYSVINFPEMWGDDLINFYEDNQTQIDVYFERYKSILNK